jgi:hypothetical protein
VLYLLERKVPVFKFDRRRRDWVILVEFFHKNKPINIP